MPIQAVTLAIRDLLVEALNVTPDVPPGSFTVFVGSPDAARSDDDLILSLLRINPDGELRNAGRAARGVGVGESALPLELHYLVTAGAPVNDASTDGLIRLGQAILAIEGASPLSVPSSGQDAVWLSLEPMSNDELSRIWGLFPHYTCRPSFIFRAAPIWLEPGRISVPAPQITAQGAPAGAASHV
jgi:hypothetical protein